MLSMANNFGVTVNCEQSKTIFLIVPSQKIVSLLFIWLIMTMLFSVTNLFLHFFTRFCKTRYHPVPQWNAPLAHW